VKFAVDLTGVKDYIMKAVEVRIHLGGYNQHITFPIPRIPENYICGINVVTPQKTTRVLKCKWPDRDIIIDFLTPRYYFLLVKFFCRAE
jgi:hypothetical protein